jgi:hypothetical protein
MILFHVPAPRLRAILRHRPTNATNQMTAAIPVKIVNNIILSALPAKISIAAYKKFCKM